MTSFYEEREMAHPAGLEPATPRFEAWYSIQLNYRCADTCDIPHEEKHGAPAVYQPQAHDPFLLRFSLTSQQLPRHRPAVLIIGQQNLAVHHGV